MTTRAGALFVKPVEEQVGEQERREMVEGEGVLEPVGGDVPGVPVAADVVDQHIDPGEALEHLGSQPPHLRLGGEVRDEHVHVAAAGGADLASRVLGALAVPAGDREVRTHRRQAEGGRFADASAAAGDQHRLAGHRKRTCTRQYLCVVRCSHALPSDRQRINATPMARSHRDHATYRMGIAVPASAQPRSSSRPRNSADPTINPAPTTTPTHPIQLEATPFRRRRRRSVRTTTR